MDFDIYFQNLSEHFTATDFESFKEHLGNLNYVGSNNSEQFKALFRLRAD